MNTPAHIVFGLALQGRPGARGITWAAGLGGLAPDVSLYLMAGWALGVAQIPPEVVFGRLYFSDAWQTVFAIDNSVFVWGAVMGAGLWLRTPWLAAFGGAALLHVALDFPLHHDDGRPHFWPVSDWVFESPVSYWDRRHYAGVVVPIEALATVALAVWCAWRHRSAVLSGVLAVLVMAQLAVGGVWAFVFAL